MQFRIPRLNDWEVVRVEAQPSGDGYRWVATARRKRALGAGIPHVSFTVPDEWSEAYVEALAAGILPVPPIGEQIDIVAAWIEDAPAG